MDWLGLIEAILPRRLRQLIAFVFVLGLFVFPQPFVSLFWSLVRYEEQQVTALLERGVGGTLRAENHQCRARAGAKCQR